MAGSCRPSSTEGKHALTSQAAEAGRELSLLNRETPQQINADDRMARQTQTSGSDQQRVSSHTTAQARQPVAATTVLPEKPCAHSNT